VAPTFFANLQPLPTGFLRRLATLLLASTLVLLLAGSALASIDASRPMMVESPSERSWVPSEVPDVALLVAGLSGVDPVIDAVVVPSLLDIPGVTAVATELLDSGRVSILVSLAEDADDGTVDLVTTTAQQFLPENQISVGGRAVVDRDIVSRLHQGMIIAVVPVLVLLLLLISAAFGIRIGLVAAAVVALSSALGGAIGAQVAGDFDGSLATTAVPAVLVAILVSSVLTFRLLDWFKHPQGSDQADTIRLSISHLLPEAGLLFGGLVATALTMELFGSGRASATVVAVGGLIAAVVTLGALPAMLVTMPPVPNDDKYRSFRLPTPDGRDFPLAVLAGFACFLLVLGLFALRVPSDQLLDSDALPPGEASRRVSEQLVQSGGDPSDAIVATIDQAATPVQLDRWASVVSALPVVGWVETSTGRYEGGVVVESSAAPTEFATSDGFFAIVSPTVTGRSSAAQDLVGEIQDTAGLPTPPELTGVPVDASSVASSGASGLWLLVALLALTGGLTVYLLLGDLFLASVTVGLRLLGTAASLGVFYLVASSVSGSELQVLALIVNVGVGLFEIGFLRRIGIGRSMNGSPVVLVGDALRREGRAAMFGLGVTALVGLGFLASDIEVARRLGIAVCAGVVIELLIGTWLLRPVVLGERAAALPATRATSMSGLLAQVPSVSRLQSPISPELQVEPVAEMDPEWRRIVSCLLRAEFECQTFPESTELSTIMVENTPLFEEVATHNRRLLETGLRVAGRPPIVKAITVVNTTSPVALSVMVEHPLRHLVGPDGHQIGQRPAQIREGMLWLMQDPSGRYRIAEAVDMGAVDSLDLTVSIDDIPSIDVSGRVPLSV